jgi:hypothetical protein
VPDWLTWSEISNQFRYLLDQSSWQNDGNADAYVPSGVSADDNSVVVI